MQISAAITEKCISIYSSSISQMTTQKGCLHQCFDGHFGSDLVCCRKNIRPMQISVAITEKLIPLHMSTNCSIVEKENDQNHF